MVKIENLSKKYGDHVAVEDMSFEMEVGKIYGLLGPNGAGKSTTMNMMCGYLAPSSGTVEIEGHLMDTDAKNAKRHIGYLPENPPLYPDMTVHEYLLFVAELKGIAKKNRMIEVEGVMEDVGVTDMAYRLIKNLSKGYRQRVGLAGAMLSEPDVMILDEPTAGLDPKQIISFRELIKDLSKEKIIMISSHILSEISAVCDHVFIINNGHLLVDDDVENLDEYVSDESIFTVNIKGDASVAIEKLNGLEGVTAVEKISEGEISSLKVHTDSKEDMTESISLSLMEERIPILGLNEEKGSLEQIFLEITEEDRSFVEDETKESEDTEDTEEDDIKEASENSEEETEELETAEVSEESENTIETEDLEETKKEEGFEELKEAEMSENSGDSKESEKTKISDKEDTKEEEA